MTTQIIGLCDQCYVDIGVPLEQLNSSSYECMACDAKNTPDRPVFRYRMNDEAFERLKQEHGIG